MSEPDQEQKPRRTIAERIHHSEDIWAQARRDYLGGATASAIFKRYGIKTGTLRRRAWRQGWCKSHHLDHTLPEPLIPFPDPAQAVKSGDRSWTTRWMEIARVEQMAPPGDWSTWLFQGGRGAGKTRAGAEWLAEKAERAPGLYALVGPTQHDVREVMVDGPSGLRSLPGRERPWYERSRRRLLWENGSVAHAFSAEEPERLRGPQFAAAWADEFCIWPKPAETLANLRMALRLGARPQLCVTTTPKPIAALRALRAEPSCVLTLAGTAANAANLAPSFVAELEALYGGTRLAAQELEGLLVEDDGALWRAEDLARARVAFAPAGLTRIVVGVDPPKGAGVCGIVVAARAEGRFYVLRDASVAGAAPRAWAEAVCAAARMYAAGEIVAEANQGGDMVRAVLAAAGPPCAVRLVHARAGKRARAEPVAVLYAQGRVAHVGAFAALEEEMLALGVGGAGGAVKLDRADALVWAVSALRAGEGK